MRVEVGFLVAEMGVLLTGDLKSGSKKRWKSLMHLCLCRKPATRFGIFPAGQISCDAPVYLNVYDLTPMNSYVYWAGFGIFHSGVQVHGVEYAYGAHDYPTSGVFEVEPGQCPGFRFRKSIFIGRTRLDPFQVREFMELHFLNYHGDTYHLIVKNCNHFCKDICYKLTGNSIPKWVNRLARIGSLCNFLLPDALKVSSVCPEPDYQPCDDEKRSLRSTFSCLCSISMCRKQFPAPSLSLPSPLKKGFLPPSGLRKPPSH